MRETPIILLGLDAADAVLIERWAAEGRLPAFAELFASAAHGRLDSSAAALQASVWPSFATGCNPGKHASYYLLQMRPGTREVGRVRADHLRRPPFWTWLEGPAQTAVVVDVPKVPPLPLNGVQVVEWGTTDHYWEYATVPADLARPLAREFGSHPLRRPVRPAGSVAASLRLRDRLLRGVAQRQRLHRALLERHSPRVFVSVFSETHPAGHSFWRFLDESHPAHRAHPRAGRALLDVYAAVDRAVGELLTTYGDGANCIVFSGHGMEADHHPHAVLGELLVRMGLTVRAPPSAALRSASLRDVPGLCLRALAGAAPPSLRRLANRSLLPPGIRESLMRVKALHGVDFSRSRAFVLPTDLQGFLRLNLRGREPNGIVVPREQDSLCDEITAELHALSDAETGEPVVAEVLRPRELYRGADNLDHLPDLCVVWTNTRAVSHVCSPKYGTLAVPEPTSLRSGNHRLEGLWFASGPDFDGAACGRRAELYDIAPTVFRLLGKPIPADWDGAPLPAVTAG